MKKTFTDSIHTSKQLRKHSQIPLEMYCFNGQHLPIFPSGDVTVPTVVTKTFVFR